jgi:hypothetical protein
VVKRLSFPVQDTRARATGIFCFPCQISTRNFLCFSSPPFFSRLLPTSRLLLRVRLAPNRRASAVTR